MSDEIIMVCVAYGPHGERLIDRGARLANMLQCPLHILYVSSQPYDRIEPGQRNFIQAWQQQAERIGAQFVVQTANGRKPCKVIAEKAMETGVTQIVLGQSHQTRWREMTRGSFANELMKHVGSIDLHIVAVASIMNAANAQSGA